MQKLTLKVLSLIFFTCVAFILFDIEIKDIESFVNSIELVKFNGYLKDAIDLDLIKSDR